MMPQTHYEVLGVAITATPTDIRKAYQVLARRWHPDLSAHLADSTQRSAANERFKLITAAYNTLNHPDQRRAYDATLQHARRTPDTYVVPTPRTYFDFSSPSGYFGSGPIADYFHGNFYAPPQTDAEREEALRQAQERVNAQSRKSRERVERLIRESNEHATRILSDAASRRQGYQRFRDL